VAVHLEANARLEGARCCSERHDRLHYPAAAQADQGRETKAAAVARDTSTLQSGPHAPAAPLLAGASGTSWALAFEPAAALAFESAAGVVEVHDSSVVEAVEAMVEAVVVAVVVEVVVGGGVPGWQATELVAPAKEVQWPAEHAVHSVAPKSPFHEPAAHFVHVADALPENFPGGHSMHVVSLACPTPDW